MSDMTEDVQDNSTPEALETIEDIQPPEHGEVDDGGASIDPRGALAFVILVLIFYFGYYMISWFEIFVLRGS